MAVFASDKPAKTIEEEAEMNPNLEASINPLDSSSSSSSSSTDWYLGSDSISWSGSYGSDNELGIFDWVNVISDWVFSDESRSTSDEEFPVNIASIPVGFVLSVKGKKVIVEGKEKHNVLKGSFLWVTETKLPLGYVDKIFGTVKKPCFRVRFKSESQVPQGISQGTEVSIIVEDYVQQDKKGGCNDETEIKLSDDEKGAQCSEVEKKKVAETGDTGNKKDVSGYGRSEEQTLLSPIRSDSEVSPVKSQANEGAGGMVPQIQPPLPQMGKFAGPRRSEILQQKPYQPPMAKQMQNPVSTQAPTWTRPMPNPMTYTQTRFRNRQNHTNQRPYPNAEPWPDVNSNRTPRQVFRPPNPQTQPQSLNAKPSSDKGRGLQQYFRGVGKGRGFGLGRGRVLDQA